MKGVFKINSRSLNESMGGQYADGQLELSETETSCIEQVVEKWKRQGVGFDTNVRDVL